jgi:hypothetical protein
MQGLITKELRDSFNIPVYYPSVKEIQMAVEKSNGSGKIKCICDTKV